MRLSSRKLRRNTITELSMTSFIDVVFLLLIFFMTTASFIQTERNLDSKIKVNRKSGTASDLEPAIVRIVKSGDRFVFQIGGSELASRDELANLLRQFPNKGDGAYVRVGGDVPFQMSAAAVQACKDAGFDSVSYVPLNTEE